MQVESIIYYDYNSYSNLFLEFVEVNQLDSRNQDSRPSNCNGSQKKIDNNPG